MARTALSLQEIIRTGLSPSYTAANVDGHSVANDGKLTFVHVKNGSGGEVTVTIDTPGTVDGLAIADRTVAVPAGEERIIGPFPTAYYNQADGTVHVDFSAVTSVTIAAFKV
jgi:hypothetical protein